MAVEMNSTSPRFYLFFPCYPSNSIMLATLQWYFIHSCAWIFCFLILDMSCRYLLWDQIFASVVTHISKRATFKWTTRDWSEWKSYRIFGRKNWFQLLLCVWNCSWFNMLFGNVHRYTINKCFIRLAWFTIRKCYTTNGFFHEIHSLLHSPGKARQFIGIFDYSILYLNIKLTSKWNEKWT